MRRFRAIIALGLAVLWLPATLCCAMEAAGWDVLCTSESCHADEPGPAEPNDGCSLVEDGRYQSVVPGVKVSLPAAAADAWLLDFAPSDSPGKPDPGGQSKVAETRPRDWVPEWHFTRRTVAPAQAPASIRA